LARTAVHDGEVTFGVRPEKVRVMRTPPQGAGDDVKGVVLDVSFTGVATQYLVRLPSGAVWSCYEQNLDVEPIDLRPGDDVWIAWNPHHAFGVPVDEAQARAAAEAV
jgi:spermidine/putrescine transport system ATP-binding protein